MVIKNRSEILFVYDVRNTNPNGDPLDEDRPRMDEETEKNIVTDVRLKRTIRDYFIKKYSESGKRVFIREEKNKDGELKTRKQLIEEEISKEVEERKEIQKTLFKEFIDLRLFGATLAVEDMTVAQPGPVQFKFGQSLHSVEPKFIKGTTVMPSKEKKEAGTMTEMWVLPYSLIAFYGVVNENAAVDTGLTRGDIELLLEGIWKGTKGLITRSKVGQEPRVLVEITYKKEDYHIGELDKLINLKSRKKDKEIRDISETKIDITELLEKIEEESDKIKVVKYKVSGRVEFLYKGEGIKSHKLGRLIEDKGVDSEKIEFK